MSGPTFPSNLPVDIVLRGGTGTDIQAALDSLVPGRDFYQKLVTLGEYTVDTQIELPDYIVWEHIGKLNSALSTGHVINASTKNKVRLSGEGIIDCNTAAGTSHGINLSTVDDFGIKELTILDARAHCVNLSSCTNGGVSKTTLEGHGDDGISLLGSRGVKITENDSSGGTGVTGGSSEVEVEDDCRDILIALNRLHDGKRGVSCVTDGTGTNQNKRINILGNELWSLSSDGVNIENSKNNTVSISILGDGTTATVTETAHGKLIGDPLFITSAGQSLYNAATRILDIPTPDTYTYKSTGTGSVSDGVIEYFETDVTVNNNNASECGNYAFRIVGAYGIKLGGNTATICNKGFEFTSSNIVTLSANTVSEIESIGISSTSTDNINSSNNTVINAGLDGTTQGIAWSNCVNLTSIGDRVMDTQAVPTTKRTGFWNITGNVKVTDLEEIGLTTANRTFGGGSDINLMQFRGCNLFGDSTRGSATIAAGNSTIAVTHGLMISNDDTPDLDSIQVTPTSLLTDSSVNAWKIGNMTDTQFTITLDTNAVTNPVTFTWHGSLDLVQQ